MKGTAFAFITLIVGAFANPAHQVAYGTNQQRIVTGLIIGAIEELQQSIQDAGLDPFESDGSVAYELPVPVIFAVSAFVDSLSFTGLSNIAINEMNFSILTNRLTFDLSLPRLQLVVGGSGFAITLFGKEYEGSASGSVAIVQPRVSGNIRVNVGIISGISVRSLALVFNLEAIESNVSVNILGNDISSPLNTLLGTTIPDTLNEFAAEINELLEAIAWQVIEEVL